MLADKPEGSARATREGAPLDLRRHIRPEEALLLLYALALAAVMQATHTWVFAAKVHSLGFASLFLSCFVVLAVLIFRRTYRQERLVHDGATARRRALRPALAVVRDFFPFLIAILLYEMLHDLTPVLRPVVVDDLLIAIDRRLFGTDLSWWLGRFASPALTHIMVFCYTSYFFAPGLLASLLYWNGERRLFRDYLLSMCFVTVIGYVGYILVPAVGPYVYQSALFPTRLPGGGMGTHSFVAAIDDLRGIARDCFPSLHTAHTLCVLAFAWRFSRKVFWGYLPIGIGLIISTLYLRYHYGIDLIAGFATAAGSVAVAPRIEKWWFGQRAAHFGARDSLD